MSIFIPFQLYMPASEDNLQRELVVRSRTFTMELFPLLVNEDKNIIFSPLNVQSALVLVSLGSKGGTKQELQNHISLPEEHGLLVEKAIRLIMDDMVDYGRLNFTTEAFVAERYHGGLRDTFKRSARKFLRSFPQGADFDTTPGETDATFKINLWMYSETRNRIDQIVRWGSLDKTAKLIIVCAMDFKDVWLEPFNMEKSRKHKFFTPNGSFCEVDMMYETAELLYCENSIHSFKVLQIPFLLSHDFQMMIFLPNNINGLPLLRKKFPQLNLAEVAKDMNKSEVSVTLPKFNCQSNLSLKKTLKKLGINTMFDHLNADLTGMHELTEDRLHVSKVCHSARINFHQIDTVFAKAEGMAGSSSCPEETTSSSAHEFKVDHPFIFCILFKEVPLFVGQVVGPKWIET